MYMKEKHHGKLETCMQEHFSELEENKKTN